MENARCNVIDVGASEVRSHRKRRNILASWEVQLKSNEKDYRLAWTFCVKKTPPLCLLSSDLKRPQDETIIKHVDSGSFVHKRDDSWAPSTRIRIFSNPQLFRCGYGYRPHVYGEFDSEFVKK